MNDAALYLSLYLSLNHLIINIFILIYLFFFICFYTFSILYLVGQVSDIWNEKNKTDPNKLKILNNFICLPKVEAYE